MNKLTSSKQAIEELERGTIELFPMPEEQREYEKILLKMKSKSHMLKLLDELGYTEFCQGVVLGHLITIENKKLTKRSWIPSIFKK